MIDNENWLQYSTPVSCVFIAGMILCASFIFFYSSWMNCNGILKIFKFEQKYFIFLFIMLNAAKCTIWKWFEIINTKLQIIYRCGCHKWCFHWEDHQEHGHLQRTSNHFCPQQSHKQSWVHSRAVLHTYWGNTHWNLMDKTSERGLY